MLKQYAFVLLHHLFILTISIVLCLNPYSGSFSYDFNFILGIVVYFTFIIFLNAQFKNTPFDFKYALFHILTLPLALIVVLLFSFKNITCDYRLGFIWFLLMPTCSAFFALACVMFSKCLKKKFLSTLFYSTLPCLILSVITLYDLFVGPQISFVHGAFGYFFGPVYDELVLIEKPFLSHRAWTILFSLTLIALSRPLKKHSAFIIKIVFTILLLTPFLFRYQLKWATNTDKLEATLSLIIEGQHASIHTKQNLYSQSELKALIRSVDYYSRDIHSFLGINYDLQKIKVYIYPDIQTKHRFTSTRTTYIGNPITRSVHMLKTHPMDESLRHELVHAWSSPIGYFGLTWRYGLVEGLASAYEYERGFISFHEWSKAMMMTDKLPNITQAIGFLSFLNLHSVQSYHALGSFTRWIIDQYGIENFKRIYLGHTFEETYRTSLHELIEKWKAFLHSVNLSSHAAQALFGSFRGKSLTQKICPHDFAYWNHKSQQCKTNKNFDCQKHWLSKVLHFDPSNESAMFELALVHQNLKEAENEKLCLEKIVSLNQQTYLHHKSAILLADQFMLQQKSNQAQDLLNQLDVDQAFPIMQTFIAARKYLLANSPKLYTLIAKQNPTQQDLQTLFYFFKKHTHAKGQFFIIHELFIRRHTQTLKTILNDISSDTLLKDELGRFLIIKSCEIMRSVDLNKKCVSLLLAHQELNPSLGLSHHIKLTKALQFF